MSSAPSSEHPSIDRQRHALVQGEAIPKLGFGTWQMQGDECRAAVEDALELGYRHLDTAVMYGNEAAVGAAIRESRLPRKALFVTTKIWHEDLRAEALRRSVHESLDRLGLAQIDLLLIHWPSPSGVPLEETLGEMRALQERGLARLLGVSNFPLPHLHDARSLAPIACNQVEMHPYLQQTELRAAARQLDLALTAYCPLAKGEVMEDAVLSRIGAKYGKSPAQIALRWLVQHPPVVAIPKASSHAHRVENLKVFDFSLDAEDANRIAALDRRRRLIDPSFAPNWAA